MLWALSGRQGLPVTKLVQLDLYQLTLMYVCREMHETERIRQAGEIQAIPVVAV